MNAVLPVLACLVLYALGYLVYARFLSEQVFGADASRPVPSETLRDDVDYIPTPPAVLFAPELVDADGARFSPEDAPPGDYTIQADFGEGMQAAGAGTVVEGSTPAVYCSRGSRSCVLVP